MTDEKIINECHREIKRLRAVVRDMEDELGKAECVKGILRGIKDDIKDYDFGDLEVIERINTCLEMLGEPDANIAE